MLIQTSGLRLIDVAYAAGFSSVRQFNDTIRAVYGRTPTRAAPHRRGRRASMASQAAPGADGPGVLTVRLAFREPLRLGAAAALLRRRAPSRASRRSRDGCYRRTLRLPHGHGVVALTPPAKAREPRHVECELRLADLRDLTAAVQRCRRLLDLDADPAAPAEHLAGDPLLAPLVRAAPGLRVPGTVDGAELAIRAVLGQQVSVAARAHRRGPPDARRSASRWRSRTARSRISSPHPRRSPPRTPRCCPAPAAAARRCGAGAACSPAESSRSTPAATARRSRRRCSRSRGSGRGRSEYIAMRGARATPTRSCPATSASGARWKRSACVAWRGPREAARLAERWRPWRAYALQHLWGALAPA